MATNLQIDGKGLKGPRQRKRVCRCVKLVVVEVIDGEGREDGQNLRIINDAEGAKAGKGWQERVQVCRLQRQGTQLQPTTNKTRAPAKRETSQ